MEETRIQRAVNQMKQYGLTQMLVTEPASIFYLTGQMIYPGERMLAYLIREKGGNVLFVNDLFTAAPGDYEIVSFNDIDDAPAKILPYLDGGKALGIDKEWPSRFLLRLMDLKAAAGYVNSGIVVDKVRAIKDASEREAMISSSLINDKAMGQFALLVKEGLSEKDIASKISGIYKSLGAKCPSEGGIVSFGANAADPHHGPDDTVLKKGQCVLFDVSGVYNGYYSDMTRTFFTAQPTEEQRKVYELVLKANLAAEAMIRPGVALKDIDAAARDIISEAGYGKYFTHRLGHFIGLTVHEYGDVSSVSDWIAEPGMVFSVEPGIYLPGNFGVRIEDLVMVTEEGCMVLNHYPKELTVLAI
ncbi:MAG: aminopeptidase P family protein [Eubacteriaceae bacterium]|nr:aminopeptidase P family protein [Eubacteriaceae bacterium]